MFYYVNKLRLGRLLNHQWWTNAPQSELFWWPSWSASAMPSTSPNEQWRGSRASLEATWHHHRASTHIILPRRMAGLHAEKKTMKKYHTCRPICRPWRSASTISSASPDRGGGPELRQKPLVAVIGGLYGHGKMMYHHRTFQCCIFKWDTWTEDYSWCVT